MKADSPRLLWLVVLCFLLIISRSALGMASDEERFVNLVKAMEEHPWVEDHADLAWMQSVIQEGRFPLTIKFGLLRALLQSEDQEEVAQSIVGNSEVRQEDPLYAKVVNRLGRQYLIAQSAHNLQNPDRVDHPVEVHSSAINSMLILYGNMRKSNPEVVVPRMDELLELDADNRQRKLKALILEHMNSSRGGVPEKFRGDWVMDPNQCALEAGSDFIEIWQWGVRLSSTGAMVHGWNSSSNGLAVLIRTEVFPLGGAPVRDVDFLTLSEDQASLKFETDRQASGDYFRCPQRRESSTSLAEAKKLALSEESIPYSFSGYGHPPSYYLNCREHAGQDENFMLYMRFAETGRVKEALADSETAFSACIKKNVVNHPYNYPPPAHDDFWLRVEIEAPQFQVEPKLN